MKSFALALLAIFLCGRTALAYGPLGHEIVGAIADERLAKTPAGAKISQLLEGLTLERASTLADEIKSWDKDGPDASRYHSAPARIDMQLREFWKANPPTQDKNSAVPSHHWFHYSDVPLFEGEKYGSGKLGRHQWDIVHMIPFCVAVLRGEQSEQNARKITRPVAIILLAHYLGDVHQPLHVGAEYFDKDGHPLAAKGAREAIDDQGGNSLSLIETSAQAHGYHHSLHGFWDNDVIKAQFPPLPEDMPKEEKDKRLQAEKKILVHKLANEEPKNWRLSANVPLKNYAEAWVDEILPIAREAHRRLQFEHVRTEEQDGAMVAKGDSKEKRMPDGISYHDWSARIVHDELHKAGWRLADLMEKSLSGSTTPAPSATIAATIAPTVAPSPKPKINSAPTSTYGAYPVNYKELIIAWMKANAHADKIDSIQWQGEPRPGDLPSVGGQHVYGYLVIFNTRAATGSGMQTHGALLKDDQVLQVSGFTP